LKSPFPALAILQRCVVGRLHGTNQSAFGNSNAQLEKPRLGRVSRFREGDQL
jgi:hypothetical protein